MTATKQWRLAALTGIALVIFSIWFADGYLQWVNSDTAGEAYGVAQEIAFPQGLTAKKYQHHARITATVLSYLPFRTVGIVYRQVTGDPVNALYVSQGVMTGALFALFLLVSAAYVSSPAPILSGTYLASSVLLLLLAMSIPPDPLTTAPLHLSLRFHHQAIMSNYVGTLAIALLVLFPYWRYLFSGQWDDWYGNLGLRSVFYTLIIAAVFSSTATMLWLGVVALAALVAFVLYSWDGKSGRESVAACLFGVLQNSKTAPLLLIIALTVVGVMAESTGGRAASTEVQTDLAEYFRIYFSFLAIKGGVRYAGILCALLLGLILIEHRKGVASNQLVVLAKIFPWLLVGNLVYLFVIGLPRIPYRFGGYNLGSDTALPATWSMVLWVMAVTMTFWRENKLTWVTPVVLFVLSTNAIRYFSFPAYELRELQKTIFTRLHHQDKTLSSALVLPIPVENVAFTALALRVHTMPMLREMHIVSPKRKLLVVSKEVYESWLAALAKDGVPPLLKE